MQPTYRPYKNQAEAIEHLRGKWVRFKNPPPAEAWPDGFSGTGVRIHDIWYVFSELMDTFIIDGHPCGIEKKIGGE